ncbi:hypothetical protein SAMN05421810_106298 [Amycolatopsis arida]|uniref:Lon N-terminal domain-containing protein n=1 Tax=Amycolatopsis arida TaxID=587909 RepID=A0A1I5XWL9_9PSEU|nr:LON peptidase substrate-binding domain-containing protein [Amycolatopsis arida]TDX97221.1 hypothetical protein CLV69_102324 [Amycolatopsis arida]SFQ36349.1 hypothetical protein SAMN05421810_106298 [Amycolatopsis arida]
MGDTETEKRQRATLPLFPLQAVLMPGALLPLHIFEPRYRQLTVDLIAGTVPDREFGVVATRTTPMAEVDSVEHVHAVGCVARLREATRLPDGRFDIVVAGHRRFRLHEVDAGAAPYLMGTVEWLDDRPVPGVADDAAAGLAAAARAAHRHYCAAAWRREDWTEPPADTPLGRLPYALAADCVLSLADQQRLLEEDHPLYRLSTVLGLLHREAGLLSALRAVPAPPGCLPEPTTPASLN